MEAKDLIRSEAFHLERIRYVIYDAISKHYDNSDDDIRQVAAKCNTTPEVIQHIEAEYDGRLSDIVRLAIGIGKVPVLTFESFPEKYL